MGGAWAAIFGISGLVLAAEAKMGGAGAVILGISGWVWAVDSIYSGLRPMETLRALQGPMALSYRALRTHMDP